MTSARIPTILQGGSTSKSATFVRMYSIEYLECLRKMRSKFEMELTILDSGDERNPGERIISVRRIGLLSHSAASRRQDTTVAPSADVLGGYRCAGPRVAEHC